MNDQATGAQSAERALAVLKAVAEGGGAGATTAELAARTGLNRTTAHRLVGALAAQGFVERSAEGRVFLGAELVGLGMIAGARRTELAGAAEAVQRLSAQTGDTAFLSALSGYDAVCLQRQEGEFPIRTQVLWPGQRHPLGIGAGSLAMLAAFPDERVAEIVETNAPRIAAAYPRFAPDVLWGLVRRTRAEGHAVNEGMIVAGSWAVGVAILGRNGAPAGALSLSAIEPRMSPARRAELAALLRAQADRLALRAG